MKTTKKIVRAPLAHGVGRRKSSVARVWLREGTGAILVNGKAAQDYFETEFNRTTVGIPFKVCAPAVHYDIEVNVNGGGLRGQADAAALGIARALLSHDENLRPILKKEGLLTVDSRLKERKKYGQRGARRKFQFVKR